MRLGGLKKFFSRDTDKKDEKPAKKEVKKKFLKKTKPDGTIETTLIEKRYGKR